MQRTLKRIVALMLCILTIFGIMSISVNAATTVKSYNCSGDSNGGESKYFYVKTGTSSNSRKVKLTMEAGKLSATSSTTLMTTESKFYGCYEVKIYYYNTQSKKWVKEDNFDAWNTSSTTITLDKKNTYYKIQIYSWRVSTVFSSYWNHNVKSTSKVKCQTLFKGSSASNFNSIKWTTIPKCTATPKGGCTMYKNSPV